MKQRNKPALPPRFALWLLEHFCAPHLAESIEGDLYELFYKRVQSQGEKRARILFVRDVLLLIRPRLLPKPALSSTLASFSMLPTYLFTALRMMRTYKTYTAINIFGLTVSITSCLLILLYLQHELSYDKYHTNAKNVYRLVVDRQYTNGNVQQYATTSFPLGTALQKEFSQIQEVARVFSPKWISEKVNVSYKDNHFYEDKFFFADSSLFNVLTIPFVQGSASTSFSKANAVVMSEKIARKYFGNHNPVGEILQYEDSLLLEVTGVFRDLPSTTHLQMDFISTMAAFGQRYGEDKFNFWGWDLAYTYLLLPPDFPAAALKEKLPAFFSKHTSFLKESRGFIYQASLQPIADIHLYSHLPWELEANGNISNIYILFTTVSFLLLIAGINFINLTSALAGRRALEVGIRKVFGAGKLQLMVQFLSEYALSVFTAVFLGLVLTILLLPSFNELTQLNLRIGWGTQEAKVLLIALTGILMILTLLAGGYVAALLVRLHPVALLKKRLFSFGRSGFLKEGLLVIQFSFSIVLSVGTMVAYKQYTYMSHAQVGFDKDQVVVLRTGDLAEPTLETLKHQLLAISAVQHVSASSGVPGGKFERMRVRISGKEAFLPVSMLWVDHDFIKTMGLHVVDGRDFSSQIATDKTEAYIINRAAQKLLDLVSPVGEKIEWPSADGLRKGPIIGVVEDFHYASLKEDIEPLVMLIMPYYGYLSLKINPQEVSSTLQSIEKTTKALLPLQPFDYQFLDENINRQYQEEEVFSRVLQLFTLLSVVISCLGLFALSAFSAGQRVKEIAVRKVLGASEVRLVLLLARGYVKQVVWALLLGFPIAYLGSRIWLQDFAYRISIDWWVFALVAFISLLISFFTVSFQAVKASLANPVTSLRE